MFTTSLTAAPVERRTTVTTDDGVALAVREWGRRTAALTVVFLHGHCLRAESWTYVRDALRRDHGADFRMVGYDHRGHGDSDVAPARTYTLEQLARDLHAVIDAVAPTGRVLLVGHSMGGMTALTYARLFPQEVGTRVAGVALVATAANGLAEHGFGRFLRNPAVSMFQSAVRRAPGIMHNVKQAACRVFAPVVRAAEYGDRKVSPRVVALASAMRNETPIVTMATFLSAFMNYDETAALAVLAKVPSLVLCGSADLMTPLCHSTAMADGIAGSDLVEVEGAGHSVIMEQPARVAEAVATLASRVAGQFAYAA